jgi:antitoxin ParD1/3/4
MPAAKQLSVTLDADLAAQVDEAVASGAYASASEVVEDALACWRERRALEADPETLRRLWQEGLDSGSPQPLDMAEIKRAARARILEEAAGPMA